MINLPKICQEANQSKNKQKMQEAINKVDMGVGNIKRTISILLLYKSENLIEFLIKQQSDSDKARQIAEKSREEYEQNENKKIEVEEKLSKLRKEIEEIDKNILYDLSVLEIKDKYGFIEILERGYDGVLFENDERNFLVELLIDRFEKVEKVGEIKKENNIPALQQAVWDKKIEKIREETKKIKGLDLELVIEFFNMIHDKALELEK